MSNTQLVYVRSGATAVITALAVLYSYYPSEIWITAIISAAATLGIHAIPAIQQGINPLVPSVKERTVTVSEQPEVATEVAPQANPASEIDGMSLMGLRTPVTDTAEWKPESTNVPPDVPESPPVAPTAPETPSVVGVTVHLSDGSTKKF